jgi:glycosyltransferase involved in cell wall biosynthesis
MKEQSWTLEIIGDGEERTRLEHLTETLWIRDRVSFLGRREHDWIMREFYPRVDIFVNPSLQEWLPTTVIEALGMGCQVIATDVGGTREIEGITLFEPWNKVILQDLITRALWESRNHRSEWKRFSLDAMKNNYLSLFHEIWK